MTYDVVTIGDAFEDIFLEAKDIEVKRERDFVSGKSISFELGEKIPLKSIDYEIGGSACNAAVGFSRLNLNASVITVLGDDSPAEHILERLDKENVDKSNVKVIKPIRSNFSVVFRVGDNRTIFVYHSLDDYSGIRIKKNLHAKWYFLAPIGQNSTNIENDLVAKASEDDALVAWNPGSIQIKQGVSHFRHLLKCTSVLFLNREEAIKFVDYPVKPTDFEVMKKLFLFGPKIIVMTNGKEGARAYDGHNFYHIDAFNHIRKVDATGAGDSFATGFTGKLISANWHGEINPDLITEALKWGVANSSSVLGFVGGQKGLLTHSEIEKEAKSRRFEITIKN